MKTEKHIPYYAVLDALKNKECPICYLVKDSIEKYFDTLLYEGINDVDFRMKFNKSSGFCNFHAYKFLNYHDGLAAAIIYREILIKYINEISANKQYKNNDKICAVCLMVKEKEEQYLSIIAEYLYDEEFKMNFTNSHGLCFPHYFFLLKDIKSIPDWLKNFHIKKYQNLLNTIDKFIDNCNAALGERCPQLTKEEELCWIDVIQSITGFEGNK